jgi:hypothetical protein
MASKVTQDLQDNLKEICSTFDTLRNEAKDIYNLFWKGSVNADITLLSSGNACCQEAKLTKAQVQLAATLVEQMGNFWDNAAVAQADYLATIQSLLHGDAVLATPISSDLEAFGNRAKQFAQDLLTQYNRTRLAVNHYNNTEISAAVGAMSAHTVVFGADMTKDDLTSAVTMLNEYLDFCQNAAVAQADYKATLGKWQRL